MPTKECPNCKSKNVYVCEVISDDELDWLCRDCGYGWYEDYA